MIKRGKMREGYNYWLNRTNYFGDGLAVGLVSGLFIGMYFGNIAAIAVLFTFLGGAVGAFIRKKKRR